jgi:hypothetical protein
MSKEKKIANQGLQKGERGITPGKVAYMYGITMETFSKWMRKSEELSERMDEEDNFFYSHRKWTPKQLQMVFDVFGDPREYKDIIDSDESGV